jgi:hypothetical protein
MVPPRIVLPADDLAYLVEQYTAGRSIQWLSDRMGYSRGVIARHVRAHGMMRGVYFRSRYSDDDIARLRAMTWPATIAEVRAAFPGRTIGSIRQLAHRLGIKARIINGAKTGGAYTAAEDAIIRANYGVSPVRTWMHLIPGRTHKGLIVHARKTLGLRSGIGTFLRGNKLRFGLKSTSEDRHGSAEHHSERA